MTEKTVSEIQAQIVKQDESIALFKQLIAQSEGIKAGLQWVLGIFPLPDNPPTTESGADVNAVDNLAQG